MKARSSEESVASVASAPAEVTKFASETAAELLEQELGGQAKISYLYAAPYTMSKWLSPILEMSTPQWWLSVMSS